MRKTKIPIAFALVVTLVAGCSSTGGSVAPPVPPVGINESQPQVEVNEAVQDRGPGATAPGSSQIPDGMQFAFCQDQVAFMNGVDAKSATTGQREVAANGSTSIGVTVNKATGRVETFKCRLDASGRFVDVIAEL